MPFKRLPKTEYDARREKGLCFNCNEKYTYAHKCARQFQIILVAEDGGDSFADDDGEFLDLEHVDGEISLKCSTWTENSQFYENYWYVQQEEGVYTYRQWEHPQLLR